MAPAAAPIAYAVVNLTALVVQGIFSTINDDTKKREQFTSEFVDKASQEFPNYNIVIVHPQHEVRGNDWVHNHIELPISSGKTIGYEVYFSPKGKPFIFKLNGDGGFINWAYNGEFTRDDRTLTAQTTTQFNIINLATGLYLDSNDNGQVYTLNSNGGNYQKWLISENTIQNLETGLYLDSNDKGQVYTLKYNGGNYQKWVSSPDGVFQNVATNLCLDSNANGQVYTLNSNGGNYQKWRLVNA